MYIKTYSKKVTGYVCKKYWIRMQKNLDTYEKETGHVFEKRDR